MSVKTMTMLNTATMKNAVIRPLRGFLLRISSRSSILAYMPISPYLSRYFICDTLWVFTVSFLNSSLRTWVYCRRRLMSVSTTSRAITPIYISMLPRSISVPMVA